MAAVKLVASPLTGNEIPGCSHGDSVASTCNRGHGRSFGHGREEKQMKSLTRRKFLPVAFVVLVGFFAGCCAVGRLASAQDLPGHGTMPRDIKTSLAIPVCEDVRINRQVKEALRLVCAEQHPVEPQSADQRMIIIGFTGGFVSKNDPKHPEVWFGTYLRQHYPSANQVEVLPNHDGDRALHDIVRFLDTNHDGSLTDEEKKQAKIVLYGHSWGASETVALARDLKRIGIPVLLTVQIDTISKPHQKPAVIPSNVEWAINFFQPNGLLHGNPEVVAESPSQTKIIGNVRMTYDDRSIDCGNYPWFPRTFNKGHHQIENDAQVGRRVASVIDALSSSSSVAMN